MTDEPTNGWNEWKNHVLIELDNHNQRIGVHGTEMRIGFSDIRANISAIETKMIERIIMSETKIIEKITALRLSERENKVKWGMMVAGLTIIVSFATAWVTK